MDDKVKVENIYTLFIAKNLKSLRELHDLKTSDLARVLKITRQGYIHYETGKRDISIAALIELSVYYNISIDEIVGNPFSLRTSKKLAFKTYKYNDGVLAEYTSKSISTVNNDIIVIEKDDYTIDFFWKTLANNEKREMLFLYHDVPYISKVYQEKSGHGFFFVKDEPKHLDPQDFENIIFLGVYMGTLTKEFQISHFF